MSFKDKLIEIELLRQQIEDRGPLPDEVLRKVNYKFRLEWNYNSNSMEGNTLTRQETRSVMVGIITVDGKPFKDVLEMKGHDDVIASIIKMGKGELNLSEKRIKEIHKGIMHEEDPEKAKLIGQWKAAPNYLFNYKNERFDFVAPADVPERMHQLINRLNTQKEKIQKGDKDAMNPVEVALRFHLDFITIHPFYDGNGRTVRILTNLILIAYGYPPLYIKLDEKEKYYQYLADIQGYGGKPDLFYDFMAGLLIRSQHLIMEAVEGKEI
jgi:Fic family protein